MPHLNMATNTRGHDATNTMANNARANKTHANKHHGNKAHANKTRGDESRSTAASVILPIRSGTSTIIVVADGCAS
jgi:hypothetical protein